MKMALYGSRKEKFLFYNTLTCVVKALENKYTTVDLRNDNYITGKIKEVDGFMNIELEDVFFYDTKGNVYCFDTFFIYTRNIRHVHIPKGLNINELIKNQLSKMQPVRKSEKAGTLKVKRAKRYQEDILKSLQQKTDNF